MAFDCAITTDEAFKDLKAVVRACREHYIAERAVFLNPTTPADRLLNLIRHFEPVILRIDAAAAVPGIREHARAVYAVSRPDYDPVAEAAAMRAALVSALTQLDAMFPRDPDGWVLYQKLQNGRLTIRLFTAAQLAPVVSILDELLTTMEIRP